MEITTKKVDEMNKSLNETQEKQEIPEKTIKQVMKTIQDLKTEMEAMKKSQTEGQLDLENIGK